MNLYKSLVAFLFSFLFSFAADAQNKQSNKPVPPIPKEKLPHLKSFLGIYTDSVSAPAIEVASMIGTPLRITDEKNNVYTVTYYEFLYKRLAVKEDEATGKLSPTYSIASEHFKLTPLSELWVKKIREDIKAGEELFFFDILVKDALGHVMYAPDLKIMVK